MRRRVSRNRSLAPVLLGALMPAAAALGVPAPAPAPAEGDAVRVYSAGMDAMLPDERDAALRQALGMLQRRLGELPGELGDGPAMTQAMIDLVAGTLTHEMSLRVRMLDEPPHPGAPPVAVTFASTTDGWASAREHARMIHGMLGDMAGFEALDPDEVTTADRFESFAPFERDGVRIVAGVAAGSVDGRMLVGVNDDRLEPVGPGDFELPAGVRPVFGIRFDPEPAQPLMRMAIEQASPAERDLALMQLETLGMLQDDPVTFEAALGYDERSFHGMVRIGNMTSLPSIAEGIDRTPLGAGELELVPADATVAWLRRSDLAALPEIVRQMTRRVARTTEQTRSMEEIDPFEIVEQVTGIDFEHGLLVHLGTVSGGYMAESTGGGGLVSLVSFVEVTDERVVDDTLRNVRDLANRAAATHLDRSVQLREQVVGGQRLLSLTFPGLPIPFEPAVALADGRLWMGMTARGVLAAIDHARGDGPNLRDNPRFRALAGTVDIDRALSIDFTDTPVLARKGYGLTSMLGAGLANLVRARDMDRSREPGLIVPSLDRLLEDARGSLMVAHLDGEDLVMHRVADRSAMLGIASIMGLVGSSSGALVAPLAAGVFMPAMASAREQARAVKSMSNGRQIAMAMMVHAAEHDDRPPASIETLVEAGYLEPSNLESPLGPAPDDRGAWWMDTSVERLSQVRIPDRTIAAYDRVSYVEDGPVVVVFYDGHVEQLDRFAFDELLAADWHAGIDFDLPW